MKIAPRHTPSVRCAYCHGDLGPVHNRCPTCATPLHLDCWERLPECPILGCAGRLGAASPLPRAPSAWLWAVPAAAAIGLVSLISAVHSEEARRPHHSSVEAVPIDRILGAAVDTSEAERLWAVKRLRWTGGPKATEAITDRLRRDESARVRLSAAQALGVIATAGHEDVLSALNQALEAEQAPEVRAACVRSLVRYTFAHRFSLAPNRSLSVQNETIQTVTRLLESDPDGEVRLACVQELSGIYMRTRSEAVAKTLEDASDDSSPKVRHAIRVWKTTYAR